MKGFELHTLGSNFCGLLERRYRTASITKQRKTPFLYARRLDDISWRREGGGGRVKAKGKSEEGKGK